MKSTELSIYVSSKSSVKLSAVARAFSHFGTDSEVQGFPVESGVDEQPLSIEATYEGARNRHNELRRRVGGNAVGYLVTCESGVVKPFENAPWKKGCEVVIVERIPDGKQMVGIDFGVEYPQAMMDKVPSIYLDLGVLMQEEYGFSEKDPVTYLTGGRLTRADLIEQALVKVLAQMDEKDERD